MSPDPYNQYHSPYIGMGDRPHFMVDPDGGKAGWVKNLFTRTVPGAFGGGSSTYLRNWVKAIPSIGGRVIERQEMYNAGGDDDDDEKRPQPTQMYSAFPGGFPVVKGDDIKDGAEVVKNMTIVLTLDFLEFFGLVELPGLLGDDTPALSNTSEPEIDPDAIHNSLNVTIIKENGVTIDIHEYGNTSQLPDTTIEETKTPVFMDLKVSMINYIIIKNRLLTYIVFLFLLGCSSKVVEVKEDNRIDESVFYSSIDSLVFKEHKIEKQGFYLFRGVSPKQKGALESFKGKIDASFTIVTFIDSLNNSLIRYYDKKNQSDRLIVDHFIQKGFKLTSHTETGLSFVISKFQEAKDERSVFVYVAIQSGANSAGYTLEYLKSNGRVLVAKIWRGSQG